MLSLVTSNKHKHEEIFSYLNSKHIEIKWVQMSYEEIQADDNETISIDSCKKLTNKIRQPFFLEDTGLYIANLNGFPGPYSSYVQNTIGNENILKMASDSKAYFKTVITLYWRKNFYQFSGMLNGKISSKISGNLGFGYDPIFIPDNSNKTLGEMTTDEKNKISHRFLALKKLYGFIVENDVKNNL